MFDLGFIKDIRFLLRRMPARERTPDPAVLGDLEPSRARARLRAHERARKAHRRRPRTSPPRACASTSISRPTRKRLPLLIGLLSRSDAQRTHGFRQHQAWVREGRAAAGARRASGSACCPATCRRRNAKACSAASSAARSNCWSRPTSPRAACTSRRCQPRVQFRPAVRCRRLRAPHRPHRAPRRRRRCDQLRLRRYAQRLPDIEAYIEQKIPVGQVDPELLVAIPPRRALRLPPWMARNRRKASARFSAKCARRRRPRPSVVAAEAIHRAAAHRVAAALRTEAHRAAAVRRTADVRAAVHPVAAAVHHGPRRSANMQQQSSIAPKPPAVTTDGVPSTRKPRRHRGGRGRGAGEQAAMPEARVAHAAAASPAKSAPATPAKPSLLGKIKQGLKKLVKRPPRSGH